MEEYVKILKENSLKVTPQRLIVLKYLGEHFTHPTTDEIYQDLKANSPSLSKTTVYNVLEVLEKNGIIQSITISRSELRYDFKHGMHHHFLCKKCGRITDIDVECPNLGKMLECGHNVEEVHGYFKGICKKCMKKENDNGS
ncbi:MAG: transcriptional repressor [Thermoplasmatales archaeon]|nr:transcriptional repressor [Thermoplasmatales archaeon]MCK4995678.1 transcriptional repressor [Thermoplasmatales archaeon]MCK5635957.1 transcriptional repressor [Thermoplasmatales archaeon]